jgi:hypothetical protein
MRKRNRGDVQEAAAFDVIHAIIRDYGEVFCNVSLMECGKLEWSVE